MSLPGYIKQKTAVYFSASDLKKLENYFENIKVSNPNGTMSGLILGMFESLKRMDDIADDLGTLESENHKLKQEIASLKSKHVENKDVSKNVVVKDGEVSKLETTKETAPDNGGGLFDWLI